MSQVVHLGKQYFPDYGGIETATKNLAETAVSLGLSVECRSTGAVACLPKTYYVNGVCVRRHLTLGRLLSTPLAPGLLRPLARAPGLLHVHLPNPLAELATLWILARPGGTRRRLLPFFHALPFRGRGIGGLWFRWITRPILRRAEKILVSSSHLVSAFPPLAEFREKIVVVPFVTEAAGAAPVERWWAEREVCRTVLALGRFVPYKGHLNLIRAWGRSGLAAEGYRLALVGGGPLRNKMRALVEELGLASSVEIHGACSEQEKAEWLRRAMAFALPSVNESETFGIAALEAMAYGLPVLASSLPTGLQALTRKGACGAEVPPGDIDALALNLRRLLCQGTAALRELGEANRRLVDEEFSPQALRKIYGQLVGELRASGAHSGPMASGG